MDGNGFGPVAMRHEEFLPPEAVREYVKCLWYNDRDFGAREARFEILPDGYAEIVFSFGAPCRIASDGAPRDVPSPFLMGLLDRPVLVTTTGRLQILGIRCYPWAVFDLLGLSPDDGGAGIVAHPIAALQAQLDELVRAGRIDEALRRLRAFLADVRPPAPIDETLRKAGQAMREGSGALPVGRIAGTADVTVRTLERKFKTSAGRTVKDVSAVMRFEHVRNRLWLHPATNLAALALEVGYADQSHLSREFKRFSGTTPSAFARKAERERHAARGNVVAFLQA